MSYEPQGNDGLPVLDVQADEKDEQTIIQSVVDIYNKTITEGCQQIKGKAFFKNGLMQEMCMPADASTALIEGSGSYMMHLAFWLSIEFFVESTSEEFFCYKHSDGVWSRNNEQTTSFLNQSLNELKWAHILCFILLLGSKFYYFNNVGRFTLDQQGVMRLLTIPLYLTALYRAEYNIRRFRPFYDDDATPENYTMIISEGCLDGADCKGGEFCFAQQEGSAYQWLWLELMAFIGQLVVMFIMLVLSYCKQTVSKEPKNADYILVKDYRDKSDPTKRKRNPTLHVLNREFKELWPTGPLFQFKDGDGFGEDNGYKKVLDKTALKSNEDFTEILNAEAEIAEFNRLAEGASANTDQFLGGDDLLEKIKNEKIELLQKKKDTVDELLQSRPENEEDKEAMAAYNLVRFYVVKGADLDGETREIQDGKDELSFLIDMTSQFTMTLLFLVITSLYIVIAYPITYPSFFDEKLVLDVIDQVDLKNQQGGDFFRDQCKVRLFESHYTPPLWALVGGQALLAIILQCGEKLIEQLVSFNDTFLSMRESGISRHFYDYYGFSCGMVVIFYALIATITMMMLNGIEFDANAFGCTTEARKQVSIIALWIYTNFVIAALSLPGVLIDFVLEKNKDRQNMRQMIVYAHRNSLKKFYATDAYACTITEQTSTLKGKLTQRLLDRKDEADPFKEDVSDQVKKFKQDERKAANLYRMTKDEVLADLDRAISLIDELKDPDCHNTNYALKDSVVQQTPEELEATVGDMIKSLPLSAGGIYDFVFWEMFHEDNPEYMSGLKLKLCLAFGVHAMATYFYFKSIPFGTVVYFGGFELNIIRLIMAIILHLACVSDVQGALGMLTFIVSNPDKFACGSLMFPTFICIAKVALVLATEGCAIMFLLYQTSELSAIKLAPLLLIVATWDSKLVGIFPTNRSQGEMNSMPLEYVRAGGSKTSLRDASNFTKEVKEKGRLGQIGNTVIVWVLAVLNFVLGILYSTVYFYFAPFVPMVMVILQSYSNRHSPVIDISEVPTGLP